MGNETDLIPRPIAGSGAVGGGRILGAETGVNNEFVVVGGVAGSDWRRSWVDESEERKYKSFLKICVRPWRPG